MLSIFFFNFQAFDVIEQDVLDTYARKQRAQAATDI